MSEKLAQKKVFFCANVKLPFEHSSSRGSKIGSLQKVLVYFCGFKVCFTIQLCTFVVQ